MFDGKNLVNLGIRLAQASFLALLLSFSIGVGAAYSGLPTGNAITDAKALLRYALPINNQPVREVQQTVEDISNQLRGKRWSSINSDINKADRILSNRADKLLASVPEAKQPQAQELIENMKSEINNIRTAVEAKDKEKVSQEKIQLLDLVGELEELMVQDFPYEVPSEYSYLPKLKGRATVEMTTDKGTVTFVVDGYSAPVTAGNFVDLVQRGFYNGLEFTRAEESYVLQAGDPPGKDVGFVDPATGKDRYVPLEILVKGDPAPTYGITLEDAGRYLDEPVLPFSAFGALAMARPEAEPNGASSQFFFFLFEPELTPAGRNLLDGRYSVFGYVIKGKEVLEKIKEGDKILSAKVIEGANNLVPPQTT